MAAQHQGFYAEFCIVAGQKQAFGGRFMHHDGEALLNDLDPLQMDERLGAAQRGLPDPVVLSGQLAKVDTNYRSWREQLRTDPECEPNPLDPYKTIVGRTLFQDLERLGEQDPLRPYLRRWVFRLGERRINSALLREICIERHQKHVAARAAPAGITLAQLTLEALRKPERANDSVHDFLLQCEPLATQVGLLWERRAELAKRWGLASYSSALSLQNGPAAARAWLDRTQDMFYEHRKRSLGDLIESALARDAVLQWPSHLTWYTLSRFFQGTELLATLSLRSKRLPERLAPASFMRGLARLGEEWSTALAPADQFFVVAYDPYRLQAHMHAALFATLTHNPSFLKKVLGAQADQIRPLQRAIARTLLIESRVRALKVLWCDAGLQGRSVFREAFASEVELRLGFPLPETAAGALFAPDNETGQRLDGLFWACAEAQSLVHGHDEDWFRNPRAGDQLRSEAALPPRVEVASARLDQGASVLYASLAASLG